MKIAIAQPAEPLITIVPPGYVIPAKPLLWSVPAVATEVVESKTVQPISVNDAVNWDEAWFGNYE